MADAGPRSGPVLHDERLRLVLLCAHPVLAPESAAALTLRLVMGLSTADIARLFLVPAPTMAARLTRARKRVAGEAFTLPAGAALDERARRRRADRLPRVHGGLRPGHGGRRDARRPRRRGDPAGAGGPRGGARARRARRAARPDAAPALAPACAGPRRRARPAARPGPLAVGPARDRRGRRPAHAADARPGGAVPPAGAHRGRARPDRDGRRDRLAAHRREVRRARGPHGLPGRAAQPRGCRRRGRRAARRPGRARRSRRARAPAARRTR